MSPSPVQELDIALELLKQYRRENAQHLLRDHNLSGSGSWEELTDRIRKAVSDGSVPLGDVVAVLDSVEESGRQHVFLYDLPKGEVAPLRDPKNAAKLVTAAGLKAVFNTQTRVLDMPKTPTCTSVHHDEGHLRIKWVERREWKEFLGDERDGQELLQRFRIHESRAVNTLWINFPSGSVDLRLSTVGKQSRKDYAEKEQEYPKRVSWLIDWSSLKPLPLLHAIPRIIDSNEVRRRGNVYLDARGTRVAFTSDAVEADLGTSAVYQAAGKAARAEGQDHRFLNAYWLRNVEIPIKREVHTHLYADKSGNEVRFPAECSEEEEAYVLSRIRHFAKL